MVEEKGLKLRTKLESAKTLSFVNGSASEAYQAGEMLMVGSTIGVLVENVGISGQAPTDEYPNGDEGVLVYEAEKIILPKAVGAGQSFSVGDVIYYDATNRKVCATVEGNTPCGRALESAGINDEDVLADLMVLA